MKKILSLVMILLTVVLIGCCGYSTEHVPKYSTEEISSQEKAQTDTQNKTYTEKKIYAGSEKRSCICVRKIEDVDRFLDAAHRGDTEYIDEMAWHGSAFFISKDTRVLCSDSETYKGMVFITVLEGKFEGESGYTFSKRVKGIRN